MPRILEESLVVAQQIISQDTPINRVISHFIAAPELTVFSHEEISEIMGRGLPESEAVKYYQGSANYRSVMTQAKNRLVNSKVLLRNRRGEGYYKTPQSYHTDEIDRRMRLGGNHINFAVKLANNTDVSSMTKVEAAKFEAVVGLLAEAKTRFTGYRAQISDIVKSPLYGYGATPNNVIN